MRTNGRCALLVLAFALPALAQSTSKPKPNAALTEAFKDMSGTWVCTGSMDNPQAQGTALKTKSEMKISPEVDGFAYSGSYHMEKNAFAPAGMKGHIHWGWDDSKGKLVEFGFDNMGSTWSGTSDGLKGDTIVWSEEGAMLGQPTKSRTTVTRKSAKEITLVTETDNKGAWQKMGEDHCKKK